MNAILKTSGLALAAALIAAPVVAQNVTLRMSTPASETDQRSVALAEVFAPAVNGAEAGFTGRAGCAGPDCLLSGAW